MLVARGATVLALESDQPPRFVPQTHRGCAVGGSHAISFAPAGAIAYGPVSNLGPARMYAG